MRARNSFENKIVWKRIIKKALKNWLDFFLCTQSLFMDNVMIKKGSGNIDQSFFGLQNMSRKIPFLVIYRLGNFDDLMQSGVWVVAKTTFAYLCKPIHNVIIIPVSSGPLNLETVEGKGKNWKKKISRERKDLFRWNKISLHNFWNAFFW